MNHFFRFFLFRFLARSRLSRSICALVSSFGTWISLLTRSSNLRQPFGFLLVFFAMFLIDLRDNATDVNPRFSGSTSTFVMLYHSQSSVADANCNPRDFPQSAEVVSSRGVIESVSHLLNPHETRIVNRTQSLIGKAATDHTLHNFLKSSPVVELPIVEPPLLFNRVALQVEVGNPRPSPLDRSLEQRPEVLDSVDVDRSANIFLGMIDSRMDESTCKARVAAVLIGVDFGTELDVLADVGSQRRAVNVRYNPSLDATLSIPVTALQHALNDSLVHAATSSDFLLSNVLVHILGNTTDKSFVGFNLPAAFEVLERAGLHGFTDSVKHEPCGFLSDSECPMEFVTADAVLGVGNAPHGDEPFIESEWRRFKNGADFVGKLFLARFGVAAEHSRSSSDFSDTFTSAFRTSNLAVRPLDLTHVLVADREIGEVAYGFNESFWVHILSSEKAHPVYALSCAQQPEQAGSIAGFALSDLTFFPASAFARVDTH